MLKLVCVPAAVLLLASLPESRQQPEKTYAEWSWFVPENFDPQHTLSFEIGMIPYMSPTGGGYSDEFGRRNPAWDYRYWLRNLVPGQEVVIRSRIALKPWAGTKDVIAEYDRWCEALTQEPTTRAPRRGPQTRTQAE